LKNRFSTLDLRFPKSLWRQRDLLLQLSIRDIQSRYRGSALGWGWSLITPLLTLAVYTFVFSQIFKARWGNLESNGPLTFAINLFAGLIVFTVFAETANQAPNLISSRPNLVTKVVFPLEILPAVGIVTSLFHAFTSLAILGAFKVLEIALTTGLSAIEAINALCPLIWMTVIWIPLALGCLSISWALAALGVYLRDLGQIVGVAVNLTMFLSAVFYPLSSLPPRWQPWLKLNPIVPIIEESRNVALTGGHPSAKYIFWGSLITILMCEVTFRLFQKAKIGFADVL
jgi:lipopolysaccharide transport system permease protein